MFQYDSPEDDVLYIETCRDLLYDALYVIYNSFVYELVEQYMFNSYVHGMESYKFVPMLSLAQHH
jgi:hypothetical protein